MTTERALKRLTVAIEHAICAREHLEAIDVNAVPGFEVVAEIQSLQMVIDNLSLAVNGANKAPTDGAAQ